MGKERLAWEVFPASPTEMPSSATLEQHLGLAFCKAAEPAPSVFPVQCSYLMFKSIT